MKERDLTLEGVPCVLHQHERDGKPQFTLFRKGRKSQEGGLILLAAGDNEAAVTRAARRRILMGATQ